MPRPLPRASIAVLLLLLAAACSGGSSAVDRPGVAFVLVGDRDDLGYNQAVWEGQEAVARAFPNVDVTAVEGVPESPQAAEVMQHLVDDGADIVFATSFGHRDAAIEVARANPDVVVLHQGGLERDVGLPNFGTYFGSHAEAVFAAGIAAGAASDGGTIGFIAAFPIPATYNNVNALLLGARETRPDATVSVVFTGSWCDPDVQAAAAARLLAVGADVLAQHQDCTRTVLEAAEAAGVAAVGYHSDGSEVAPSSWLTGAIWVWPAIYIDIVETVLDGDFVGSPYEGDYRGGLQTGDSPFALAEPGPRVSDATAALMEQAVHDLADGSRAVFAGPLTDVDGELRVGDGTTLDDAQIDTMDYFLDGVTVRSLDAVD